MKKSNDGLVNKCYLCRSEETQEYYKLNRDTIKEKTLNYYKSNKEKLGVTRKIYQKQKMNDPLFLLTRRLRNRLYYALKKTSWKKKYSFFGIYRM